MIKSVEINAAQALEVASRHYQKGNLLKARQTIERIIGSVPDFADAHRLLAQIYIQEQKPKRALQAAQKAVNLSPDAAACYLSLAAALENIGQHQEAETTLLQALDIDPDDAKTHFILGNNYKIQGKLHAAEHAYRSAIKIQPEFPGSLKNLGTVLGEQGNLLEALDLYQKAQVIDPGDHEAHWNESLTLLALGREDHGWAKFDHGFDVGVRRSREFGRPQWRGQRLQDKTILVYAEQGAGEHILYTNAVPHLAAMSGRVVIESSRRMSRLLGRSFPEAVVYARDDPPHPDLCSDEIDYQTAAGSVFQYIGHPPFPETQAPLLVADPDLTQQKRQSYELAYPGKLKVGLSWQSTNVEFGAKKSIGLSALVSILNKPEVGLISLQYGETTEDLSALQNETGIQVYEDHSVEQLRNLETFAAQVSALDLIVTISNTTAHMAGSLGKETWVMLPLVPHYYWHSEGDSTPWYPSAHLFRQHALGDWGQVLAAVDAALSYKLSAQHD